MRDLALPTFDKELRDLRPIPLDITEVSCTQAQLLDSKSVSKEVQVLDLNMAFKFKQPSRT